MINKIELSVILTTYNEDVEHLRYCIDSIRNQSFTAFQLIIVLEPNDKNISVLRSYQENDNRIILIVNEINEGFVRSLNIGLSIVDTEFIARIDSDDICKHDRFEKQIKYLKENKQVDVLGSGIDLIDKLNKKVSTRTYPLLHSEIKSYFLLRSSIAHPSVMFRKSCIDRFGTYNEEFLFSEDLELWLRFLKNSCIFANIDESLIYYRIKDQIEFRNKVHWRYNYLARKRHSYKIWNFVEATLSLILYKLVSIFSDSSIKILLKSRLVKKMKGINNE